MTEPDTKTPSPRRKALLIAGAAVLLLVALTAFGIPQWAYWEIQASIADSHLRIAQSEAQTQQVGGVTYRLPTEPASQAPLDQVSNRSRAQLLREEHATAENKGPCNELLTPLNPETHPINPGPAVNEQEDTTACVATPGVLRSAWGLRPGPYG